MDDNAIGVGARLPDREPPCDDEPLLAGPVATSARRGAFGLDGCRRE